MNEEQIAPVIEEICGALEDIDESKVKEELLRYIKYGIEVNEAKRSIIRKYGGGPLDLSSAGPVLLKDLKGNENNITVNVKCLSSDIRTTTTASGEKTMVYGLAADNTMIRRFVSWDNHQLEKGKAYSIRNASARTYRGEVEVNLGNFTDVEEIDDEELLGLDVKDLPRFGKLQEVKLKEIRPGMGNLLLRGKVLDVEKRTIETESGEKRIFDGVIADETHRLRFTSWHDFGLNIDDVVEVKGAYVKDWRGIPQINFDERAHLKKLTDDIDAVQTPRMYVEDLQESGASDIIVEGTIIEIREGSGLIHRCPMCNRALSSGSCSVHGPQEGIADLRVKFVMDDGTGALFTVLNTELTEEVLGMGLDESIRRFSELENGADVKMLSDHLLGGEYELRGNVIKDDFGPTILPSSIERVERGALDRARELLRELEGI